MAQASDEIVWQIISHQFCSFKLTTPQKTQSFCRNEYNLTGLCNRTSCPLANSRYATVRSDPTTGKIYLYMKTIERAHLPSKQWEKILLSENYVKALEQLDSRLQYWPKYMIHKCKQRMTRLVQVKIKTARLAREEASMLGEQTVPVRAPKIRRREATRERRALAAARIERQIEKELVDRMLNNAYGDMPVNLDEQLWRKVLKRMEKQGQAQRDDDLDEEEEEEIEEELEGEEGAVEYVSGDEMESDLEDFDDWLNDGEQDAEGSEVEADDSEESVSGGSEFNEEDEEDDSEDSDDSESGSDASEIDMTKKFTPKKPAPKDLKRKSSAVDMRPKTKKRANKVEIEYEEERELPQRERAYA